MQVYWGFGEFGCPLYRATSTVQYSTAPGGLVRHVVQQEGPGQRLQAQQLVCSGGEVVFAQSDRESS